MESMWSPCGVCRSPSYNQPKNAILWTPHGVHMESVEFMWSRGVHEDSMGQGKVHLIGDKG